MKQASSKFSFLPSKKGKESFTFVDICAGIGGMRLAFEALGGKCVFSSEWDEYCQKTYSENFGDIPEGDITKISPKDIPKHDVLLAGFPCQPFSKGGISTRKKLNRKNGFHDKNQGRIFFHIAKIISEKKPKAILLENVPQLERMDGGNTFGFIIKTLEKAGYTIHHKIINSEKVVPQRRSRLFIVGMLTHSDFEFPEIPDLKPQLRNILQRNVDEKYTLSDNLWKWLQKHAKKHEKKGNGYGYRIADLNGTACTLSARYGKDGSEILIPQRGKNPRKLTPRECARLMGFPDQFRIIVSNAQAYKQFGNTVVVPVVYIIGHNIVSSLKFETNSSLLELKIRKNNMYF